MPMLLTPTAGVTRLIVGDITPLTFSRNGVPAPPPAASLLSWSPIETTTPATLHWRFGESAAPQMSAQVSGAYTLPPPMSPPKIGWVWA